MKAGHEQLKGAYGKMNIGDIEKLMDDMADLNDDAQDIQDAIGTAFAVPDGFDEADCEAEFAALEEEMKMEQLAGLNPSAAAAPSYLSPPAAVPGAESGYAAGAAPLPTPEAAPADAGTDAAAAAALMQTR